jgi:hypothetical protein
MPVERIAFEEYQATNMNVGLAEREIQTLVCILGFDITKSPPY